MTGTGGNEKQIVYWNDVVGPTWVEFQHQLDAQISPLGRAAMARLAPRPGEYILDVGCGCGQTTLEIGRAIGDRGRATGIDISEPMLGVARTRQATAALPQVEFRRQDAQTEPFAPGCADAWYSRFGVMFFADPIAAFRNLRAALKPGGRLAFVCWRSVDDNPWMQAPYEAARSLLPASPPADPFAPGPHAYADPGRVTAILDAAGYTGVALEPYDALVGGADVEAATRLSLRVGPLGAALREHPGLADAVAGPVRELLARHETPGGVLMRAGVWIVTARNPAAS